ncbi:enoyl-CoA hydratase/carnithine racemase [Oikeobacillus pervagus]|uniref:3-hydroxyisobutyryl-CoA hydrolase n=1 Tax=Oikeobacillus pervagus TaxID=1325931 RepID=A0AAJ1SXC0_9BACI|nr:enoyl-CoA hydratase/isomerase family protein [Oikeobacillus pervagus]MDQ0214369.1 enoyl-CoA hydratase/carnithine racemase [Oikeobacillus pervagus]
MTNEVLFSVNENGVASITLNRPKALNSLSYTMVKEIGQKLDEWKTDSKVRIVMIRGAGDKGLCAGGDIKALYEAKSSEAALQKAEMFFGEEYKVDRKMYAFPKPIIACLEGIVMGGGVGLTFGASHRIVTERTKWAMPEMNIGFFPDVGAGYFLSKAPGYIGRYLALSASIIGPADVLYIKAADLYMSSDALERFIQKVKNLDWHQADLPTSLDHLVTEYASLPENESELSLLQTEIDKHFAYTTMEEIVDSLAGESEFAMRTKETLLSKSPVSLKVTLKQQVDAKHKDLSECFEMDLILAKRFMRHEDFFEGVRSVLIDRDQSPQYKYKKLSDVSDEFAQKFFIPLTKNI